MNGFDLPAAVEVAGAAYAVHTDYRDILDILVLLEAAANGPAAELQEAAYIALHLFYQDFAALPPAAVNEAYTAMCGFIACGQQAGRAPHKLLDWQQDAPLIAAEVNRVAGCEVRALPYLHWHTFMGWFGCIGEGQLATVVGIRHKRAGGKKLEAWEREFYHNNRQRVDFARQYSQNEQQQKQALWKRLGGETTGKGYTG